MTGYVIDMKSAASQRGEAAGKLIAKKFADALSSDFKREIEAGRTMADTVHARTIHEPSFLAGVEAAAKWLDDNCSATQDMGSTAICDAYEHAATAIRSLKPPKGGDET